MTQAQASGPVPVPPLAAMLRATVLPMVIAGPVIVLAFWITRQAGGGLAALLGVCVAVVFFVSGLYVMKHVVMRRGTNASPRSAWSVMAGALTVYLGQVIFLALVILSLQGAHWLDGTAFGLSVLAVALIWQLSQVVAFVRLRKPLYDAVADGPALEWRL